MLRALSFCILSWVLYGNLASVSTASCMLLYGRMCFTTLRCVFYSCCCLECFAQDTSEILVTTPGLGPITQNHFNYNYNYFEISITITPP